MEPHCYVQLTRAISLNDVCDALKHHAGALLAVRGATPPSRNGLSHANRTRTSEMAGELFYEILGRFTGWYPDFGRLDISFKLPRGVLWGSHAKDTREFFAMKS